MVGHDVHLTRFAIQSRMMAPDHLARKVGLIPADGLLTILNEASTKVTTPTALAEL